MRRIAIVLAGALCAGGVFAAEDVGGLIAGATWTAARSPYRVVDHIIAQDLTIDPGVTVEGAGPYEIVVSGRLIAQGTETLPIVFKRADPAVGWMGLRFEQTPDGSVLEHFRIEGATNSGIRVIRASPRIANGVVTGCSAVNGGGLSVQLEEQELTLERCVIENNSSTNSGGGVFSSTDQGKLTLVYSRIAANQSVLSGSGLFGGGIRSAGNLDLIECQVTQNLSNGDQGFGGGIYAQTGRTKLWNCLFERNRASGARSFAGGAIYLASGTLEAMNSVFGCNVSGNGSGVFVLAGTATIINCTFAYNSSQGINRVAGSVTLLNSIVHFHPTSLAGTVTATYCDIEGFPAVPDANGNFGRNPGFASLDCSDLRIVRPSPCIDAGNPDPQYNDVCFSPPLNHSLGGPRNDIGAHGGPGACMWPGLPDCNANSVSDAQEIAEGRETDCNQNGLPDSCDLAAGTSRDSDLNGVPDECQGRSVELVRADFLTWHLVVQSDIEFTACEFALAFDPRILALLPSGTVTAGPDLPAGGQLLACPSDCAMPLDFSACGSLRGFTVSWVDTTDPIHFFPAGRHRLFTLRLDAVDAPPAGECSPLVFVDCIRRQGQTAYNVIVGTAGESIPLFPIGTEFCPLPFRRGDSNDDGRFDIADAVLTLLCLFAGGPCSQCPDAADANDDGALNVTDPIYLLNWRFRGGPTNPPPPPPFPSCNRDPTDQDALADCVYLSC